MDIPEFDRWRQLVHAYCHNYPCNNNQKFDLEKLRDRFGPDAPAINDDLAAKHRCARCGRYNVGLIYPLRPSRPGRIFKAKGDR
jgi:hypothetical protein